MIRPFSTSPRRSLFAAAAGGYRSVPERFLFVLAAMLLLVPSSGAQTPPDPGLEEQREAMEKVQALVGVWEGRGWSEMRPGRRDSFLSREVVESRLDGLALIVEGTHRAVAVEEKTAPGSPASGRQGPVVFHALAMLTWDAQAGAYDFHTLLAGGQASDARGWMEDGRFVWSPPTPSGVEIRYEITLASDHWTERGRMRRGEGEWRDIFSMELDRVGR